MNNRARLYGEISKIEPQDDGTIKVYGYASAECVDADGETITAAAMKAAIPDYLKFGAVREMHKADAAGTAIEMEVKEDGRTWFGAHVVDPVAVKKVEHKVYKGFSVGGKVESRDEKNATMITGLRLVEVSLVDRPANPEAVFSMFKADGIEDDAAANPTATSAPGAAQSAESPSGAAAAVIDPNVAKVADAIAVPAAEQKAAGTTEVPVIEVNASAEEVDATEELAKLLNDGTVKAATLLEIAKREFSAEERKKAAAKGHALPDGSFPINTVEDLRNAVKAYGRAKDKEAAKAHIVKRAKELGATKDLPADWEGSTADKLAATGDVSKGMWNVQSFAECLSCLGSVAASAQWDLESEQDGSPIPMQLRNWLADGVSIFKEMASEESDELVAELKEQAGIGPDDEIEFAFAARAEFMKMKRRLDNPALTLVEFKKISAEFLTDDDRAALKDADTDGIVKAILAKVGARHSKADMDRLQAAHDHLANMGAKCADGSKATEATDLKKAATTDAGIDLEKLAKDVAMLKAQPLPGRPQLRVVAKAEDVVSDEDLLKQFAIFNADGTVNTAATAIKISQSMPRPLDPRLRPSQQP